MNDYDFRGPNRRRRYGPVIATILIAGLLIAGILVLASRSDDPAVRQILPPVESPTATTGETMVASAEGSAAIDGAPDPRSGATGPHADSGDPRPPARQATRTGTIKKTATRFARISINRPLDPIEARAADRRLIALAAGSLPADLAGQKGMIQTAQIPSTGRIIETIRLDRTRDYAEVLVVSELRLIDRTTRQPLDPKYVNYLVRLEKTPDGGWAVTSWEPQL